MENDGQITFSNLEFPGEVEDDAKRPPTQAVHQESSTQPPPYWLKIALLECLKGSFAVRWWGRAQNWEDPNPF